MAEADQAQERCDRPPDGWWCSREAGHEGPCAARPVTDFTAQGDLSREDTALLADVVDAAHRVATPGPPPPPPPTPGLGQPETRHGATPGRADSERWTIYHVKNSRWRAALAHQPWVDGIEGPDTGDWIEVVPESSLTAALRAVDELESELVRFAEALREIAQDTDHPSWRKAKAIARAALSDTPPTGGTHAD